MKITLIYPGIVGIGFASLGKGNMDRNWINLGLAYIGAYLKSRSHRVDLIDLRALSGWPEVESEMAKHSPDVFGIYFNTPNYNNALKCAAIAKGCGKTVAAGGPHASIDPESLLSTGHVDHVITGEGEISFARLVESLERGERPERLIKGESVPDLDSLPFPDRELYDLKKIVHPVGNFPFIDNGLILLTSRGCPYNCAFCQPLGRNMFGAGVRFRSTDNVLDELESVIKNYGVRYVSFQDDTFTVRKEWVLELCDKMLKRGISVQWSAQSRVDTFDEDLARAMKRAGCACIFFGFESGSQRMLDFLNKGIKVEQSVRAAEICRKHGMIIFADYMIGIPTETREDLDMTLSFIKTVTPELPSPTYFTPIPGCDLFKYCADRKLIKTSSCEDYTRNPSGCKVEGIDYELLGRYREDLLSYKPRWYSEPHYALMALRRWANLIAAGYLYEFVREFYNLTVRFHFGIMTLLRRIFRKD